MSQQRTVRSRSAYLFGTWTAKKMSPCSVDFRQIIRQNESILPLITGFLVFATPLSAKCPIIRGPFAGGDLHVECGAVRV